MAMSAEHRSKFAVLHGLSWSLQMNEKFSSGTKTIQPNKQFLKKETLGLFLFLYCYDIFNSVMIYFTALRKYVFEQCGLWVSVW